MVNHTRIFVARTLVSLVSLHLFVSGCSLECNPICALKLPHPSDDIEVFDEMPIGCEFVDSATVKYLGGNWYGSHSPVVKAKRLAWEWGADSIVVIETEFKGNSPSTWFEAYRCFEPSEGAVTSINTSQ